MNYDDTSTTSLTLPTHADTTTLWVNVPVEDPYEGLNRKQRRAAISAERRGFRKLRGRN